MSKSRKQRERQRAYVAGTLHEWHAEREATPPAPPPPAPAPATPFAPPGAVRSIQGQRPNEREAWERAYSGAEVGPQGASWPDDGRHIPRMVWKLSFHELTSIPRRAYTPRVI
jgi:hypothetical protein